MQRCATPPAESCREEEGGAHGRGGEGAYPTRGSAVPFNARAMIPTAAAHIFHLARPKTFTPKTEKTGAVGVNVDSAEGPSRFSGADARALLATF